MGRPEKKRDKKGRADRGAGISLFSAAANVVGYISDANRLAIMRPIYLAAECLRYELAVKADWNLLTDMGNLSIELADLGICTDEESKQIIFRGLSTLGRIANRFHSWGKLQATKAEMEAIDLAVERHEIQLLFTTKLDLCEALMRLEKLKRQARKRANTINLEVRRAA